MSEPSLTAIKTLFALSRNICFFTGCEQPLTDPTWRMVNGEVAHIKGEHPTSARYDPDQPDIQRQGYDNPMLLCPRCHKLVDKLRPDEYPVERLRQMKQRHVEHEAQSGWLPEEQAERLATQLIEEMRGGSELPLQAAGSASATLTASAVASVVVDPQAQSTKGAELTLVEHDDGSLILKNRGDRDAFTIFVEVVGELHGSADPQRGLNRGLLSGLYEVSGARPSGIELGAIAPPRLSPGETWTAGHRRGRDVSGPARLSVSWTDQSGTYSMTEFDLRH